MFRFRIVVRDRRQGGTRPRVEMAIRKKNDRQTVNAQHASVSRIHSTAYAVRRHQRSGKHQSVSHSQSNNYVKQSVNAHPRHRDSACLTCAVSFACDTTQHRTTSVKLTQSTTQHKHKDTKTQIQATDTVAHLPFAVGGLEQQDRVVSVTVGHTPR